MHPEQAASTRGAAAGLAAAALFGAGAPVAKRLLPAVPPILLAALLYAGAGVALLVVGLARRTREAPLRRADRWLLVGITALGGVLAPILMLYGLRRVSGVGGALLLNLEAPCTIVLAVVLFREHLGARGAAAVACIVAGGLVLAWGPGELAADPLGALAIAGACLAWGIDNNLTQRLSVKDPIAIVRTKALGAASCSLALALATHTPVPSAGAIGGALALGAVSYGASLVLDVHALRLLGAAREAAYFATAPFLGALLAMPLLHERLGAATLAAAALMAAGVALLVRERHGHVHTHDAIAHEHLHVHDAHHQHTHDGPVDEPHAHPHQHAPLTHDHPHVPDLHHRHKH